ncbi:unnamed protein product [Rotaria sp. Silwood2]|nr:unnamed protein product [Rotaria sp. Silwood2]
MAYRNVRHLIRRQIPVVRRRLDRQLTAMVLLRVAFLVSCMLPYVVQRIYAQNAIVNRNDFIRVAVEQLIANIAILFVYSNYAWSFYIFLISSTRFRRQVKHVLIKECWRRIKTTTNESIRPQTNAVAPISHVSSVEAD